MHVTGVSAINLARGIAVAEAEFEAAKVAPWDAARAHFEREGWDMGHRAEDISEAMLRAAAVFDAAEAAALAACCGELVPQDAYLRIAIRSGPVDARLPQF